MNLRSDKRDDESHLRVLKVDGYYLPPFVKEEHFRSMKTWKARNDDVIISAYPKAGNIKDDIFLCFNQTHIFRKHKSMQLKQSFRLLFRDCGEATHF